MNRTRATSVILLGPGFDALLAVASIKQLRETGIAVLVVGQTAGFIRDINGIFVRPEKSLSDITSRSTRKLLLLPGGKAYVSTLLTDPRVHHLFNSIVNNQGFIIVSNEAKPLLAEIEGKRPLAQVCFTFQKTEENNTISPELINLLI